MGFLGTIFIIILALWLLGRVLPFLLTFLLARQSRKFMNSAMGGSGGGARGERPEAKKEGEITVEQPRSDSADPKVSKKVGEYVDYEETT